MIHIRDRDIVPGQPLRRPGPENVRLHAAHRNLIPGVHCGDARLRDAHLPQPPGALLRADEAHPGKGRVDAAQRLGKGVVQMVVGQQDPLGAERGLVQGRTSTDELGRRPLPGKVGIDLHDGALRVLEGKTALPEPVDADCFLRDYQIFEGMHERTFFWYNLFHARKLTT